MEIQLKNTSNKISVSDAIFSSEYNEALVHQVVISFLAGARAGTKAQKTRSEVSGGGAKPWKQKGTGRARAGTIRSPIWRSGGVAFAAKSRDYSKKINKKMYRAALKSILAELNRTSRLVAVESLELGSPKTKAFIALLKEQEFGEDVLFILGSDNLNLYLAARNIPKITVVDSTAIDPALLLRHEMVVVDKAALEHINEWLS
ncbi:50S ribosomal protein L4 [Suttonella ornithocola]|uniref:Large ribosomal subunit protein uL4 n=1 Tax=Suttonella ornithocola TaxID=279832 RepID=A0A380MQ11_9GAMM|nr:50S ribosomal protein L4 [Suttonella ornithocola]SUO94699.1 50S ribosomal protein L4 [Suttonella ornithocola]